MVGPESESSTPTWECLEALVREKAQEMVQRILEEEVTELLGREKLERKTVVDPATPTAKAMASRGGLSAHGPVRAPASAHGHDWVAYVAGAS